MQQMQKDEKQTQKSQVALREEAIMNFWRENKIFNKVLEKRRNEGAPLFSFFEGPPTANGMPHAGHVLTRAMKDVFIRYREMTGHYVPRIAGWDTHGLPVELEVEKMLGLNNKRDIENYGVEKFIQKCKESVWKYKTEWEKMTERIGMWLDFEHAYITYDNRYIESLWWALKKYWEAGLLYEGFKIVPYCPRCGTALSSHEVAQGYKEVKEPAIYVKFKVKGRNNTYFMAWTTTPWTLPSNVALAVNPDVTYVEVEHRGETLILCKDRLSILEGNYNVIREFKGKELEYTEYEPLFNFANPDKKCWYVVCAEFVSTEDGTGIVHIAPAFGEEDWNVGKEYDLPMVNLVDLQGRFVEGTTWAGKFVKDADPEITKELQNRGLLYKVEEYTHTYPFCWRCSTPLLYYAMKTWFIKTTEYKDKMMEINRNINWYPEYIREGRFGEFLENNIDWALSRSRYWGTPLPVWTCSSCGHRECIGSVDELKSMAKEWPEGELDLHKPWIDKVILKCPKCSGDMKREPEVIDCWFDSGCMHTAQFHYPFENKEDFEKRFPADFICEAIDQTRGWFYTLLATSAFLYGKSAYKNVVTLGLILGSDGQKMSKSRGNYVPPDEVFDTEGADAVRWYFYSSTVPWNARIFSKEHVREANRKFLNKIRNVVKFFKMYADIDKINPFDFEFKISSLPMIDRWIWARFAETVKNVRENMDKFNVTDAAQNIEKFLDDLSNWYVRRCRRRFWREVVDEDKKKAYFTLHRILVEFTKLIAPFVPFIAEEMYEELVKNYGKGQISIHLEDYPTYQEELVDKDLLHRMDFLRLLVELTREARGKAKIKVRQPIPAIYVWAKDEVALSEEELSLILEEINAKGVELKDKSWFNNKVTFRLTVNKAKLGPILGSGIVELSNLVNEKRDEIGWQLIDKGTFESEIDGRSLLLELGDIKLEVEGIEPFFAAGRRNIVVAISSDIPEELVVEGLARELTHHIQNMRKKNRFNVTDRIKLFVYSDDELVKKMWREFADKIASEVLADEYSFEKHDAAKEVNLNGRSCWIYVQRI